jgi:tetratricopeptide (TPR) repeat protein
VAAYDAYLRGLEEHGGRSEEQNRSAQRHFEEAVALDPGFARAYAGLALTYSREAIDGWTSTPAKSLDLAARFADEAVAMNPSLPQAHFAVGQIRLFQRRHAQAIHAAERAIEVSRNYADAYALLAWTLNYAGRPNKALSALAEATRLNPRPPASYLEILGEIYFAQDRYEDSSATFQSVLEINPGYLRARLWSAAALGRAGLKEQAEWEVAEVLVASPNLTLARLAFSFPFRNPRTLEATLSALRAAGMPPDKGLDFQRRQGLEGTDPASMRRLGTDAQHAIEVDDVAAEEDLLLGQPDEAVTGRVGRAGVAKLQPCVATKTPKRRISTLPISAPYQDPRILKRAWLVFIEITPQVAPRA